MVENDGVTYTRLGARAPNVALSRVAARGDRRTDNGSGRIGTARLIGFLLAAIWFATGIGNALAQTMSPSGTCTASGQKSTWNNVHARGASGNPGRYEFSPYNGGGCGTVAALNNDGRDYESSAHEHAILPSNDYKMAVSRFRLSGDNTDRVFLMLHNDYWIVTNGAGSGGGCRALFNADAHSPDHAKSFVHSCSNSGNSRSYRINIQQTGYPSNTGTVKWELTANRRLTWIEFDARLNTGVTFSPTASPDPAEVTDTVTLDAGATGAGVGLPGTSFVWKQVGDSSGDDLVIVPTQNRVTGLRHTTTGSQTATFTPPQALTADATLWFKVTASVMSGTPMAATHTRVISMTAKANPALIPDVYSMSPDHGPTNNAPGFTPITATIKGLDFVSGKTVVVFDGQDVTPTSLTAFELEFTVPESATAKTVDVSVRVDGVSSPTSVEYTYIGGVPTLTSVSPGHRSINDNETEVTITGTNFLDHPDTTVTFRDNRAGGATVIRTQSEITFNSLTSITLHAPNRTVATTDHIFVETVHGRSLRHLRFSRPNAPAVHSVTPDTGDKGGGNKVVIKGLQFVNGSHQMTEVEFGRGNKAKILAVSDTELIVEAPRGSVGTVDVIVYNHRAWHDSDASGLEVGAYTYTDDPVITEIDPFYVPWDGPWPPVTIRGRNFPETRMGVKFGGNLIWWTNLTWKSSTELEVTPPAPWTGDPIDVVVFAEHKKDSNPVKFHYYHSHPGIKEISQTQGSTAGGYRLTIKGVTFRPHSGVMVGGVHFPRSQITLEGAQDPPWGYKQLSIVMPPASAPGPVEILVFTPNTGDPPYDPNDPGHLASNSVTFHYVDDARDNLTINPALGDKDGGESVGIKITGLTFTSGDVAGTKVTFGDKDAQVTRVTQDTITVVTPQNRAKRVDVTVEHGGRTFVLKKGFLYMGRPRVRTITPARVPLPGGDKVIIDGFDFHEGRTEVWLDNTRVIAGRVNVKNRRTIELTTPPRTTARAFNLTVKTLGPKVTYSSLPKTLTYFTASVPIAKAATGPTVELIVPDKADRLEPFKAIVKFSADACDKGGAILHLRNATIHEDAPRCTNEAAPYDEYRTHYQFWVKPTGTGDVALWVPEGEAQDTSGALNQASEVSTVGVMDVVALTRKFIQDNMLTRARRIIGEEDPDMLKRRLVRKGAGPAQIAVHGEPGSLDVKFSGSANSVDRKLRQLNAGADRLPDPSSPFDMWIKGTYAEDETANSNMNAWLVYVGFDYRLTDDTIVGLLGQFDSTRNNDITARTSFRGSGWMVGPYFAMRLHDNLIIDGRGAWGMSDNDINPIGYYVDTFETTRWLLRLQATGDFELGNAEINPFVQLVYFHETQRDYIDTPGNVIPEQSITLGHLRFGPEVRFRLETEGGIKLSPYGSLSGVWEFDEADRIAGVETVGGDGNVRPRIGFGFDLSGSLGFTVGIEGFYDGLGDDDVKAWGGSLRVVFPLGGRAVSGRQATKAEAPQTAYIPDTTSDGAAGMEPPADPGARSGFAPDG